MKTLIVIGLLAVLSFGKPMIGSEESENIRFMNQVSYNMWNGFVRGFYRLNTKSVVGDQCFGTWIDASIADLDTILNKLNEMDFSITYEEALRASKDVVDLVYKNNEQC